VNCPAIEVRRILFRIPSVQVLTCNSRCVSGIVEEALNGRVVIECAGLVIGDDSVVVGVLPGPHIAARDGQHCAETANVLGKVVPPRRNSFRVSGMTRSVPAR
jgi:hypothetical protein